ncbi:hypothetical protein BS78_08G066100 [Paspalum vaginatum]|nr:hypothetical protein BS78_08G066100 [Paspalum vaginatum]
MPPNPSASFFPSHFRRLPSLSLSARRRPQPPAPPSLPRPTPPSLPRHAPPPSAPTSRPSAHRRPTEAPTLEAQGNEAWPEHVEAARSERWSGGARGRGGWPERTDPERRGPEAQRLLLTTSGASAALLGRHHLPFASRIRSKATRVTGALLAKQPVAPPYSSCCSRTKGEQQWLHK